MSIDGVFIFFLIYFILGLAFVVITILVIKWVFKINSNSRIRQKQYLLLKQIAIKLEVDTNKINEIDSL